MKSCRILCMITFSIIFSASLCASDRECLIEAECFDNFIADEDMHDKALDQILDEAAFIVKKVKKKDYLLSSIDNDHFEDSTDSYLEGYIQALVDVHYYEFQVQVLVKDRNVTLYNLPKNDMIKSSITSFVENLPEVESVTIGNHITDKQVEKKEQHLVRRQVNGIWFPQSTVLFQPLIADLREPVYSAGYRFDDQVIGKHVIGVSFGDSFPIFRWRNVFVWKGDLQIDIQGGVWSVFKMGGNNNPNNEFSELVTTDYLVGIPLSYAVNKWSFRLRIYHVSSHLGDEFMTNNPGFPRKNPSMEAIDFISSYQAKKGIRVYFGPGWVFHSDRTYHLKPFYIEYGAEFRMFGRNDYYHRIYGTPFFAVCWKNWQEHHWQFDGTYQLGYEWSKLQGVGRKVRIFAQYHHGYSEGQFFKLTTDYFSIRFSYGF
ncbi:MAG: hypothetical protein S4CHLAM37_04050 [Chlamydiia bacterium]|nr:hypothetical protein [Chlamydiia bacterium]